MKLKSVPLTALLFLTTASAGLVFGQKKVPEHSYEGTAVCGMCHRSEKQGAQFRIWQNSLHSHAYEVLKSDRSQQIAKEKGIKGEPWGADACLKCHATGYDVDPSKLGKRFKIEDGVQCETCHGPGSDYKSIKVMKDQKLAVENGLILYENPKELCVTCHNPESPTFASFNFDEMWRKIAHPVPK
jgi:hypothetical protein